VEPQRRLKPQPTLAINDEHQFIERINRRGECRLFPQELLPVNHLPHTRCARSSAGHAVDARDPHSTEGRLRTPELTWNTSQPASRKVHILMSGHDQRMTRSLQSSIESFGCTLASPLDEHLVRTAGCQVRGGE
jgi:hypothetical protein